LGAELPVIFKELNFECAVYRRLTHHGTMRADAWVRVGLCYEEIVRKLGFEGGLPASVLVTRDAKEVKIIRGSFNTQEVSRAIKHLL
jgi:hypothetical protein